MINPDDIKAGYTLGQADAAMLRDAIKELLALRKAVIPDEFINATQNERGMFELSEDCMVMILHMLCSKPDPTE